MKRILENRSGKHADLTKHGSASDLVHRIIPLGLTLSEARAWYVNRVVIPRLRWALVASITGFIILLSMLSEFGQLLEQSLTTHLVVHDSLFLVAGFLFTYGAGSLIELTPYFSDRLWRTRNSLNRSNFGANALRILALISAASLVGYWYLPSQFNAAAGNVSSNTEMGLTLLFAGGLIFVGVCFLSRRLKLIGLVVVGKALGLYGMFLLLTPWTLYPAYPGYEQVYTGAALLFSMLILDFTVMPLWLYGYFGKSSRNDLATGNASMA